LARRGALRRARAMGHHSTLASGTPAYHDRLSTPPCNRFAIVVGAIATVLGLGAVVASLESPPADHGEILRPLQPVVVAGTAACPCPPRDDPMRPQAASRHLGAKATLAARDTLSTTGPWESPLYPRIGKTLWDRVRESSPRDHRAFLMGTSIQVHARAAAVTEGNHPYPHGVD